MFEFKFSTKLTEALFQIMYWQLDHVFNTYSRHSSYHGKQHQMPSENKLMRYTYCRKKYLESNRIFIDVFLTLSGRFGSFYVTNFNRILATVCALDTQKLVSGIPM
jgi:hypothetical protein